MAGQTPDASRSAPRGLSHGVVVQLWSRNVSDGFAWMGTYRHQVTQVRRGTADYGKSPVPRPIDIKLQFLYSEFRILLFCAISYR